MPDQPAPNPVPALEAAAEAVRRQLGLAAFDAAGVAGLDHFLTAQRGQVGASQRQGVVQAFGCYLGQCLVRTYGGEWATGPDGSTGVGLAERLFFNPFYLVSQQLDRGDAASVAAFFASVPGRLAAPPPERKRWIS
ncbi:hypothetical protein ACFQ48_11060 [Hymenobacter caeli]|uniref:DUF3806 domain-containing protein n=1 Tax=Hymenobacter caeli TaxID=2735894 RepID=A0ABX2FRU3_9BACT|nr:hypothetical protein [Hymenobacter caeli]NRT19898.1 hypothetical protein [Hymenobacter caeli]